MMRKIVMPPQDTRYRLAIPVEEAFSFAVGESNLNYTEPTDEMRQVMGLMVIDNLEYSEHWRVAAEVRACLADRWPEVFRVSKG
jgi:hypothetical protein